MLRTKVWPPIGPLEDRLEAFLNDKEEGLCGDPERIVSLNTTYDGRGNVGAVLIYTDGEKAEN